MKTKKFNFLLRKAQTIAGATVILAMYYCGSAYCQKGADKYLDKLPAGLKLTEAKPQKYLVTEKMKLSDVKGNIIQKTLITGEYTRGLENSRICWNNVRVSMAQGDQETSSSPAIVECMEGLSYTPSPQDVLKKGLFKNCPATENVQSLRTLPGFTVRIETFAWSFFDKLQLNKPLELKKDTNIVMEDFGTVTMKKIAITWAGVSRMNNKLCAIILYQSEYNPFVTKEKNTDINGSILFYGTIWVSLEDKQIEYATMTEASAIEAITPGSPTNATLTLQNDITFEKIK